MKNKDCMTANYTYDELVKAYDSFRTPVVAIYTNNSKENVITSKGIVIDGMQVTLSSEEAAGLSFQILNAFDLTTHSMKEDIKGVFSVGTVIKVALGYGSDLTTVFKGYVTNYKTSYQEIPVISVTAVDLRRLMMQNNRKKYKYAKNTYSEVFSQIIKNYENLYDTLHIDSVEGSEELTQNGTDYDFIKEELCHKANREFFVAGGDVYFKKPEKQKTAYLELEWGKNLISFQKGKSYCNQQVKVYSCQEDKTWNTVCKEIKTDDNTPSLTVAPLLEEIELGMGVDTATMNNWVDKKMLEKKNKNNTAAGSLLGLPELVPGRYIQIKGVDLADQGLYYLKEVSHSFGSDGFTTQFSAGNRDDRWVSEKKNQNEYLTKGCKGVMRAVVKQNWDEEHPGKVLVEFLTGEEGKNGSKWLPVVQPYCGGGYGFYFHPEIDTEVIVGSQMGDVNSMVVLGSIWNQVDQLPEDTAGEKNEVKRIRTKGNHEILFNDDEESGQIQISTGKKLHITLKEKENSICIFDEEEKNGIQINAEKGTLYMKADKKIILSVGNEDMIVLDGNGKKVAMEADKLEEKANQSFQIQAQKLEVKGNMTELKAEGSLKINSSGITEIKGSMVKIN